MKYFIDTEFLEGTQKDWFGRNTKPTIDLISIGIVCEDGRKYYAISKDFNLKEAWNRFDIKKEWYSINESTQSTRNIKVYWIRDNVLKPIFYQLIGKDINFHDYDQLFTFSVFKKLILKYGKTNKQIAEEIKDFVSHKHTNLVTNHLNFHSEVEWSFENRMNIIKKAYPQYLPEFYGYYADYDWVAFCWLFGKMIDLPKGFPMYCIDLKQVSDETLIRLVNEENKKAPLHYTGVPKWEKFIDDYDAIKKLPNYPKQTNEHNALADAKWNYELYKFLNTLQCQKKYLIVPQKLKS